jgi:hypothetical protein
MEGLLKKVLKGSMAVMAAATIMTLGLAGPALAVVPGNVQPGCYAPIPNVTYQCGDVVMSSCTLNADMYCPNSKHGLIIGTVGITIDGNNEVAPDGGKGYRLWGTNDGSHPTNRDCLVDIYNEAGGYECVEHGCRSEIDSGVYNAIAAASAGSGCDARANVLPGQGGCSEVTVKNLDIRGWCDGIFMSGTCFVNGDLQGQLLIDEILIEGNIVADNGMDCGTEFTAVADTVGYWGTAGSNSYFNDGIFVAMAGEEISAGGFGGCEDLGDGRQAVTIRDNDVFNQLGCGKESCPGGNNINIEGGVEEDYYSGGGDEDFFYVGCIDVSRNLVKNASFSGIQASHAIGDSDIHDNVIRGNNYGGFTYPCDFGQHLDVVSNTLDSNKGPGIGGFSPMNIKKNTVMYTTPIDFDLYSALNGIAFPILADGIYFGGEASGTVVEDNIVGSTATEGVPFLLGNDIATDEGVSWTGDRNKCYATRVFYDANAYNGVPQAGVGGCRYDSEMNPIWPYLRADLNGDNITDFDDYTIMSSEWYHTIPTPPVP